MGFLKMRFALAMLVISMDVQAMSFGSMCAWLDRVKSAWNLRRVDLSEIERTASALGIVQTPIFLHLDPSLRKTYLLQIIDLTNRGPQKVRDVVLAHGGSVQLVVGNVTNHPDLASLKDQPLDAVEGGTWDEVAACHYMGKAYIAVNNLANSLSANPVLHEIAHAYEFFMRDPKTGLVLSETEEFQLAHRTTRWRLPQDEYLMTLRKEAFAESYARYYHSPESRAALNDEYPLMFQYFEKHPFN